MRLLGPVLGREGLQGFEAACTAGLPSPQPSSLWLPRRRAVGLTTALSRLRAPRSSPLRAAAASPNRWVLPALALQPQFSKQFTWCARGKPNRFLWAAGARAAVGRTGQRVRTSPCPGALDLGGSCQDPVCPPSGSSAWHGGALQLRVGRSAMRRWRALASRGREGATRLWGGRGTGQLFWSL